MKGLAGGSSNFMAFGYRNTNEWTVVLSDYMVDPELVALQTARLLAASQASQDDYADSLANEWDDSMHVR